MLYLFYMFIFINMLFKRKFYISIGFLLLFPFSLCLAQQNETTWNKLINVDLMEDSSVQKFISDINQVKTYFCNSEELASSIFLSVVPGEEKDFCIRFENNNSNSLTINSDFFEAQLTAGGTPVCNSSEPTNLFTKSIINDRKKDTKIPAKSFVQKTIKLKFPIWYSGLFHFCHYYKISKWWWNIPMFNIVVHKQNFVDIFVNSEKVKLTWSVEILNFSNKEWMLSFSIKNTFPFDQNIGFSAVISNIFWFKKELFLSWDIIGYNATKDFTVDISDLPYYKWPFNLKMKINNKPHFDFDITNSGIDPNILNGSEVEKNISFFIFDKSQLIILVILALIIFLIKMAFFTKPKVVYIEKNNQNLK